MIWRYPVNLQVLNDMGKNTMAEHVDLKFSAYGDDWLEATLPVDHRTVQPAGLLNGGASALLAETLGSVASVLCIEDVQKYTVVGIELSCSHLRSAKHGRVTGRVKPLKIGRTTHIWHVEVSDEQERLVNVSRLTTMVIKRPE